VLLPALRLTRQYSGAILDDERGGRFRICPRATTRRSKRYFQLTNILVTSFLPARRMRVLDFMPSPDSMPIAGRTKSSRRIRGLRAGSRIGGNDVRAALDYARADAPAPQQLTTCFGTSDGAPSRSCSRHTFDGSSTPNTSTTRATCTIRPGTDRWRATVPGAAIR